VCRKLREDESRLLLELARLAGMVDPEMWVEGLRVRSVPDGGMGSLVFESSERGTVRGQSVQCRAAVQFTDDDGVEVIASLNAGDDGEVFELDVWKTDFSALIRIPHEFRKVV